MAIGKAELFSEVSRYAYQDPLTRLANRRRLDECLRGLREGEGHPTLLVCDVDGLKEVNDREGHTAGDALLRGVADVLSDVASAFRASLVARAWVGTSSASCYPPPRSPRRRRFAHAASGQIARELRNDVSVCWGAAAGDSATCTGHELIAAADAALLEAKRLGPGRLRLRTPGDGALPAGVERRRRTAPSGRRVTDDLIPRFVGLLDQLRPSTTLAALELLAGELSYALSAAGWTISVTTDDETGIRAVCGVVSALDPSSGLRVVGPPEDVVCPLAEYPCTARALAEGSAFVAGVDLSGSDPAEVRVLQARLPRSACRRDLRRAARLPGWTYLDSDHTDLVALVPHARVLAHYCVGNVSGRRNGTRGA